MLAMGYHGGFAVMTIQHHALEIYEPYDYYGENPLSVSGIAILAGPMRDTYYLVKLEHPFVIDKQSVTQLLVQPRYNGDNIDRAVGSTCTVSIARVLAATDLSLAKRLSFDDFQRWGVGKISPPT
jgi:hypothetical protein